MSIAIFTLTAGQGLQIGEEIAVNVSAIRPSKVRLEIQAPNTMPVQRGEVAYLLKKLQHEHHEQHSAGSNESRTPGPASHSDCQPVKNVNRCKTSTKTKDVT